MLEQRALLPICSVSCWSMVFGSRHSCLVSGPVLVSCRGLDTHAPGLVLMWERVVSSSLGPWGSSGRVYSLSSFCFLLFCLVLCGTQLVFFTGCVLSCLSCFVWTSGLWVSLLAACSCPVLPLVGYLFCWPCACVFVLCEHMACHSCCVPCALMSIVLTSPILFPDYWLICPTCVISLPSSFAPFIISLY